MATLNGFDVTSATFTIPRWGIPTLRARVTSPEPLTGAVTFEIAGITFAGFVVPGRGGVYNEAGEYFIVGGLGGWARPIPPHSYQGPLTRLQTVVADAARACGEKLGAVDGDFAVGPYVRFLGPASAVLEQLVPEGWWVDLDGTTRVGTRPGGAPTIDPINAMPASGVVQLAVEDVSALLPGTTVNFTGGAREISTVVHHLEEGSLRTELWLQKGKPDRMAMVMRRIVEQLTAKYRYHGVYEVRVVSTTGDTWNVEPVEKKLGLPQFPPVAARSSIPGLKVELEDGAHLLVGFVNGNPGRPYVAGFPGTADPGATPAKVVVGAAAGDASAPHIRAGDLMMLPVGSAGTPTPTPLVFAPSITEPGPPGAGHSRVES